MKTPGIAFIGAGMMGQLAHLSNYARLRDAGECDIVGLTDLKPKLAAAVAERYHVPRVYASADELLADPAVDGVVCIQQWPNNYALVKRVLQAGKSVITEKPMLGRVDEAEELSALAKSRGVLYAVGFMKRYDTGVEIAKKLADDFRQSDELGPLLTLDALCDGGDWTHNLEAPIRVDDPAAAAVDAATYPDGCRTPEQRSAYGYLLNIFSHNVNLCHHFLGAEMEARFAQFKSARAMNAALRCDGVLVTVRGASSAAHEWREATVLRFAGGELYVRTPTPMNRQRSAEVLLLRRQNGAYTTTNYHAPVDWAFFRQARGFVQALAGEAPLRSPAEVALWDVKVMQRIIEIAEIIE
ncbi:MAG TPA: Gfo/Idh/MocA family oxidoreductase [Armatimonadota bacterium]|nr:Gfo/Idh/MocA family oxidoreductase [Armatimonadota bacterium]